MISITTKLQEHRKGYTPKELDNGVIITSDNWATGGAVQIVSADEKLISLPIGEYTLKGKLKYLVVKEEGLIHSISDKQIKESPIVEMLKKRAK